MSSIGVIIGTVFEKIGETVQYVGCKIEKTGKCIIKKSGGKPQKTLNLQTVVELNDKIINITTTGEVLDFDGPVINLSPEDKGKVREMMKNEEKLDFAHNLLQENIKLVYRTIVTREQLPRIFAKIGYNIRKTQELLEDIGQIKYLWDDVEIYLRNKDYENLLIVFCIKYNEIIGDLKEVDLKKFTRD